MIQIKTNCQVWDDFMILKDLLNHFNIDGNFPVHLLKHPFNEIFLDGALSKNNNAYNIEIKTRQNVVHQMILNLDSNYPVVIISKLPTGKLNGVKFGYDEHDLVYINEL